MNALRFPRDSNFSPRVVSWRRRNVVVDGPPEIARDMVRQSRGPTHFDPTHYDPTHYDPTQLLPNLYCMRAHARAHVGDGEGAQEDSERVESVF